MIKYDDIELIEAIRVEFETEYEDRDMFVAAIPVASIPDVIALIREYDRKRD